MRRFISIILAAVLVTTPIKLALAQADQRESQVAAIDITSVVPPRTDQTPVRIGVPVVEPSSDAALLFTTAMRDITTANDSLPYVAPFRRVLTGGAVGDLVAVGFLGVILAIILIDVLREDCCPPEF